VEGEGEEEEKEGKEEEEVELYSSWQVAPHCQDRTQMLRRLDRGKLKLGQPHCKTDPTQYMHIQ